jgi:hypothetical protein
MVLRAFSLIITITCIVLFPLKGNSSDIIQIPNADADHLIVPSELDVWEDSCACISENLILSGELQHKFEAAGDNFPMVNTTTSYYWLRFRISGLPSDIRYILEVITPHTEELTVYIPKKNKGYRKYETGFLKIFSERSYLHKNFVFDLPQDMDTDHYIYVRVRSFNKVLFLFKLRSQAEFTRYSLNEYITLGIYYGLLSMLLLYNLILFFRIREWVYLYYVVTVVFTMLLSLANDGLGYAYLWPNFPEWNRTLGLRLLPLGFLIAYTAYAWSFFTKDHSMKGARKWIPIITGVYLVYYSINIVINKDFVYFNKLYMVPFLVIIGIYLYSYKKGFRGARFFILGNTFAFTGLLINQLWLLGIIPGHVLTVYSFNIGMVLEGFAFSLALVDRLALERKEKEEASRKEQEGKEREIAYLSTINSLNEKVTRELEEKVTERTTELAENNKKLESLVNQLQQMSIELDRDNWKLKKSIREEKEARIMSKEIDYDEFLSLYPTQTYCVEILEELKWTNGFICRKCGHDKSSINVTNRSRKCSKCGTVESVTAGTLFHSIKFPLNQAFYMAYRVYEDEKSSTAEKLSQITGLSMNTCSQFKRKVLDHRIQVQKSRGRSNNWMDIILD